MMAAYPELKGKVVVITGGSNGIGREIVQCFVEQGAVVHFCDILRPESVLPGSTYQKVNLRSEKEVVEWIKKVGAREKRIDVLVNNAAIDPRVSLAKLTVALWDQQFETNIRSMFLMARETVPFMSADASIINLSSITFHNAPTEMTAYVATKGAVLGFTRSLARELGPKKIRVNVISPGWIMTERQLKQYVTPAIKKFIRAHQSIPDLIQPVEIARVALFLAGDDSRAMTGQELLVDRGWEHS